MHDAPSKRRSLLCASCLAGLTLMGCERGAHVSSYEVPKETPPAAPASTPAPAMDTATMPTGPMGWTLPAGWREVENTAQMRDATIVAGEGETAIEVAVSHFGGAAGGVMANLNRWRGQIGLPPATEEQAAQDVAPIEALGAFGLLVDIVGPSSAEQADLAPRMLAAIFPAATETWFIKVTSSKAALDAHEDAFAELCRSVHFADEVRMPSSAMGGALPADHPPIDTGLPADHPPIDTGLPADHLPIDTAPRAAAPADAAPTSSGPLAWGALPNGWTADASARAMSVASFTVADGGATASMTITPLGGPAGGELANVNRWCGQVGMAPFQSLDEAHPEAIDVAGAPGRLYDLGGANGRILAVISERDGRTWFYKLTGPDALVAAQRDAFAAFVRSISFKDANDG